MNGINITLLEKLKIKIKYINGTPKGDFITYFENGQVEEKGSWNAKVYNGKFIRYYENGEIAQQKSFNEKGKNSIKSQKKTGEKSTN